MVKKSDGDDMPLTSDDIDDDIIRGQRHSITITIFHHFKIEDGWLFCLKNEINEAFLIDLVTS